MNAALPTLTARELATRVAAGELRAADVADAFLQRIAARNRQIGAFIEVHAPAARAQAEQVDRRRAAGQPLGALAGVPVALKDCYLRTGQRTGCASRILEGFVAPYTATAVARLEAADAVILGRTNMDEFAMGSSTEHSIWGATRNPFDLARTPGGSSGGSAAAVAARLAPLALGSDTGGSVRQPAALCGVAGLKPTWGRVSRHGLVAYASSLDHVAPLARTAEDLALALGVLAGRDPRDATSLPDPVPDYAAACREPIAGLRIGVPDEYFADGLDAEVDRAVRAAIAELERLGARVQRVRLPHTRYAIAAYYLIATAEASSNLARYDGVRYGLREGGDRELATMYARTRTAGFGREVRRRILLGTFCLSKGYHDRYYHKATQVRALLRRDFAQAFAACDAIAAPTSPIPAFRLGEKRDDPLAMYLCDALTTPANLAGIPGLSIPCGMTVGGLPVGLQLLAPALGEPVLLRLAAAYQRATRHHLCEPPEHAA
jgi:aspartyl-tRNA(Asn)/glutamyl-tRNA(Gln) amidotransferase subunit A